MKNFSKSLKSLLCGIITVTCIVTSCTLPPPVSVNKTIDFNLPVHNASYNTLSEQPQPELLTFDSKIPAQTMSTVITSDLPSGSFHELSLKSSGNKKNAVIMPQNGAFEIVFQQGNSFQIIDGDARDGQGAVQLPPGVIDTYMTVLRDANGKGAAPSAMFEDKLYYVKQEIKELENSKGGWKNLEGDSWYNLRKRQLPIDYYNRQGFKDKFVLNFNNSGIKDILFRLYETNTEPDYPPGVGKIGPNGGTVELPGVGRLEIPEGALNQETVISMTEELQAYDILWPPYARDFDNPDEIARVYVSSVVRLEPFGLKLSKAANIFLETDMKKVGDNHPVVARFFRSQDKIKWNPLTFTPPSREPDKWYHNFPARLYEFSFVTKQMSAGIRPDDGYRFILPESSGFNTKSDIISRDNFSLIINKTYSTEKINTIFERLNNAYNYYTEKTNVEPYKWSDYLYTIPVEIELGRKRSGLTEGFELDEEERQKPENTHYKLKSYIYIGDDECCIEHETYHTFQHAVYDAEKLNTLEWIYESSATHMGTRVFEKYYKSNYPLLDKNAYLIFLNSGLTALSSQVSLVSVSNNLEKFNKVGFYTFLAHPDTGVGDEGMIDILNNQHLDKFHDYALYAYTGERFDIYPAEIKKDGEEEFGTFIPEKVTFNSANTTANARSLEFSLNNLSAKYFRLKPENENEVKGQKFKIRVRDTIKSECKNKLMAKALICSEKSTPVKDCTEKVIPVTNDWQSALSEDTNTFSHIDIVLSSTNESLIPGCTPGHNDGVISGIVEFGIPVIAVIPGRNQNIIMNVDGAELKLDGNFSYRNSSNQVLNITSFASLNAIAGIGSTVGGSVISGQPGQDIARYCPEEDRAKSKRSGSLSLNLSFPTELDLSRKKVNGEIVTVSSKTISGTIISGSYRVTDTPDRSTRTGDCANWSSWGYNRCYVVDKINGTATITYSGGSTATVSGDFTGNGKYTQGGYWGCDYNDAISSGSPFSISESFSFTIPVTEKPL